MAEYPNAIEDTADEVTAAGGHGIAVRCDHTDDADVASLFEQVRSEHHRLDILVCNAWGGYMPYPEHQGWYQQPFWEQSMQRWDGMFTAGLRSHLLTCRFGLPLMLDHDHGLVVLTTFTQGRKYLGNVFYDVAKNAVCRAAEVIAGELDEREIAVVALSPGWMRVERMTGLTDHQLAQTESPEYIGRAVAALAAIPQWCASRVRPWPWATSLESTASPMSTVGGPRPTRLCDEHTASCPQRQKLQSGRGQHDRGLP